MFHRIRCRTGICKIVICLIEKDVKLDYVQGSRIICKIGICLIKKIKNFYMFTKKDLFLSCVIFILLYLQKYCEQGEGGGKKK